ncbi:rhomboid family intramembrane serine protease [Trichocoleus sp. FACHB-90]|uniref:rhomboid family intramembrane serine protease n=1 Tax=Cyanophyceae TaxID=3028117 RepID=UPI001682D011|nr:rhomboid family intramembrane serine protease [Trichocoleus sp. FACHB-90]MBD1929347.1 rhomboid family intramembrane serine protease [Trichocoleus sp. FACHB-90]
MIPIADNIASPRKPIINYFLISINIALFLWELKLEVAGELTNFIQHWGIVPAHLSAVMSDAVSGNNPAAWFAVLIVSSSLLSAIFLHSSFSQILGNLLFLFVFGKGVENILGHRGYLIFYLISGLLTGIVQVLVEPTLSVPFIGANGAIASVIGAYLLNFPKAKIDTVLPLIVVFIPIELPALFFLFWWFVQQVFYGIGSLKISSGVNPVNITYWTHGIGLALGLILARLMVKYKPSTAIY